MKNTGSIETAVAQDFPGIEIDDSGRIRMLGETIGSDNAALFKPSSKDIENFASTAGVGFGLTRADLDKIISAPGPKTDLRNKQVAQFLQKHFDDVAALSDNSSSVQPIQPINRDQALADSPAKEINLSDLTLYSQLLAASEGGASNALTSKALEGMHHDHEMGRSGFLPRMGAVAGIGLANIGIRPLLNEKYLGPALGEVLVKFGRPGALVAFGVAGAAALGLAGYGGSRVGRVANEYVYDESVKRHFTDEAAPAMKRLLEG